MFIPHLGVASAPVLPRISELRREWDAFFVDPNVTSVGLGRKYVGGVETEEICVSVGVRRKLPIRAISHAYRIPKRIELDGDFSAISTDVLTLGRPIEYQSISPGDGCTTFEPFSSWGTIGLTMLDQSGDPHILSNNHVIAARNEAAIGASVEANIDGLSVEVANLTRFVPLTFRRDNFADAAIAVLRDGIGYSTSIAGIGQPTGLGAARIGERIRKSGNATGLTSGRVTRLFVSAALRGTSGAPDADFENMIETAQTAAGGDSGSALINSRREVLGILIGGTPGSGRVNYCSIASVWNDLDLYEFSIGGSPIRGVIVFSDDSFRGNSAALSRSVPDTRRIGFKDNISSIRVLSGSAILYEHDSYRGRALYVDRLVDDTSRYGFGDNISSIRVSRNEISGATLYSDRSYRGRSTFVHGSNPDLHRVGMGDRVSSVEIHGSVVVEVFEHRNYRGSSASISSSRDDIHGTGLGDRISSIRVQG